MCLPLQVNLFFSTIYSNYTVHKLSNTFSCLLFLVPVCSACLVKQCHLRLYFWRVGDPSSLQMQHETYYIKHHEKVILRAGDNSKWATCGHLGMQKECDRPKHDTKLAGSTWIDQNSKQFKETESNIMDYICKGTTQFISLLGGLTHLCCREAIVFLFQHFVTTPVKFDG